MAAVRPIPLGERNQGYAVEQLLTWHHQHLDADSIASSDSESDSEVSSSPADSCDVSSEEASSSSASSSDSSDQDDESDADSVSDSASSSSDDEDNSGQYSSDESGRPAETLVSRRPYRTESSLDAPKTLTRDLVDTLGDMARTDNVGFIAWLVPSTGICTMLSTELLACVNHFSCAENFPTLSYAATFRPESFAFTGGMCLTAIFIFVSVVLFFWYLQLRTKPQKQQVDNGGRTTTVVGYVFLVAGVTSAISLFGLAVMDMRTSHDAHLNFTIVFFISAWAMMIAVQVARKIILHEDETGAEGKSAGLLVVLRRRSFWRSLRRWRRLDFFTAYTLGRLLLNIGLASTFLFGLFFLCANGVWPNPLGFTAGQEAFFEALAIVCQLLFMGTLSCELARLARLVEHRDYMELERSE